MTTDQAIQILELKMPFTKNALKKAYRDSLMVWHPDRFEGNTSLREKATAKTHQINDAYALLSRLPDHAYPFTSPEPRPQSSQATTTPRQSTPPSQTPHQSVPQSATQKKVPTQPKPDILTRIAWAVCIGAIFFLIVFFMNERPRSLSQSNSRVLVNPSVGDGSSTDNRPAPLPHPNFTTPRLDLPIPQKSNSAPSNVHDAFESLLALAESGNPEAQSRVADAYLKGDGIPKNIDEGARWYRKLADQGDPKAQYNMGNFYHFGSGVPQSEATAFEWYRKAAIQGDRISQFNVGYALETGNGAAKDEVEAVLWYARAVAQGDSFAQFRLGLAYFEERGGLPKKPEESVRLFELAAKQGNHEAQSWLGACYANGEGAPKDNIAAHAWLSLAAGGGVEKAKANLLVLEKQMSQTEKASLGTMSPRLADNTPNAKPLQSPTPSSPPQMMHLATDSRLSSGATLVDELIASRGRGKLTLDNGLLEDAYVKMIRSEKLVASFYVRGGERFTFDHIPDGIYKLIYCTGFGWSDARRDFERGRRAVRYDQLLDYATTQRVEGTSIVTSTSVITLTLHKVAHGNTRTSEIPLEEFDRY